MRYLLDTNVVSEFRRLEPNPGVLDWLNRVNPETVYLSVITIGEVKKGIEKLTDEARQRSLQGWLENDLLARFHQRIVSLDTDVLLVWGSLAARLERDGTPMPAIDALLAASAVHGDFTLVTRNEADFARAGVKLLNPWQSDATQRKSP